MRAAPAAGPRRVRVGPAGGDGRARGEGRAAAGGERCERGDSGSAPPRLRRAPRPSPEGARRERSRPEETLTAPRGLLRGHCHSPAPVENERKDSPGSPNLRAARLRHPPETCGVWLKETVRPPKTREPRINRTPRKEMSSLVGKNHQNKRENRRT